MVDFGSLERVLGTQVITCLDELLTYERDASLEYGRPNAVVFPMSTDDVVKIVRWAGERGVPLVPRGAGTGISGGAVAERGGIIIEFSRMDRVLEFDETERKAVVQPGVINRALNELAQSKGLYYPPDPGSDGACTLGGNIAENAGGPHCFKYGVTTNYVTGLEVVLADGRRVRLGGRAPDYPEYDLIGVLTGNEGTLGIITEATVRLIGNPPAVMTLMAAFDSVERTGEAVSAVIARGLMPAALELMDQKMMRIVEDYAHPGLPVDAAAALIIEVDGWKENLSAHMDEIVATLADYHPIELRVAKTSEERDRIWHARKSVAGAITRLTPEFLPVDVTVPRSKLASTLTAVDQICKDTNLRVGYVLHAGDGNLHPDILIEDPSDRGLMQRVQDATRRILEVCVAEGGSITGEHGVGIEKRSYMPLMFSVDELLAMQDVRGVFDPQNLLNPGKIFPQASASDLHHRDDSAARLHITCNLRAELYRPQSAQESSEALRSCFSASQPRTIRIRGGGTKSSLLPPTNACLSTQDLRGVLTYARDDLYVTVGAGTPLAELQQELARDRVWVPLVSPWSESTVGGIVSSNSNGPLRMRYAYGSIRDQVLAATVVLPDGRIIRVGRPLVKNVAGYDLAKLFVGSYGTLGVITDLTFKVTAIPRARETVIVPVDDPKQGLAWGAHLLHISLVASALLLCGGCEVPGSSAPYALIYTAEGLDEDVRTEIKQVHRVLHGDGATAVTLADHTSSGSEIWCRWLREASPSETVVRVGAPPKGLPFLPGKNVSFVADLASGLLYARGSRSVMQGLGQMARAARGYAVTLSGPTATRDRSDLWNYRPDALELMRALKSRWDPRGLCNPGAFLID